MPLKLGPLSLHTPLDDAKELAVVGTGATACMLLYLTVGSAEFFEEHLSQEFEDDLEDPMLREMLPEIYENVAGFVCFYLIPNGLSRVLLRRGSEDYGQTIGNFPLNAVVATLGSALAWVIGDKSGEMEDVMAAYPKSAAAAAGAEYMAVYQTSRLLYYIGWEHFYRGWMLHGLARPLGYPAANLIQTMASTLMHIGCPTAELAASFPYGLLAGGLSQAMGATWPLTALHFVLGLGTDLSASEQRRKADRIVREKTVPLFGRQRRQARG